MKKHFRISLLLALCLLVSAALLPAALAAGSTGNQIHLDPKTKNISLDSTNTDTFTLTANATQPLTWSIEDCDPSGNARFVQTDPNGSAEVEVTGPCHFHVVASLPNNAGSLTCEVTATAPFKTATLSQSAITMWIGEGTKELKINPVPGTVGCKNLHKEIQLWSIDSIQKIEWSSTDDSVVTVTPSSPDGLSATLTAGKVGTATVTAVVTGSAGNLVTMECTVKVNAKPTGLKVGTSPDDSQKDESLKVVELHPGEEVSLFAYLSYESGSPENVTENENLFWGCAPSGLVSVGNGNDGGKCKVIKAPNGKDSEDVIVTARYWTNGDRLEAHYKIRVTYKTLTSLGLEPNTFQILEGFSVKPDLTVRPSEGGSPNVTWSATGGITVNPSTGVITAGKIDEPKEEKKATLTATSTANPGITAECAVTVVPLKLTANNGTNLGSLTDPLVIHKGNGEKMVMRVTTNKSVAGVDDNNIKWYKGSTLIGNGLTFTIDESHFTDADGEYGVTFYAKSGSASVPFYVAAKTVHATGITLKDFTLDQKLHKEQGLELNPASPPASASDVYLKLEPANTTDKEIVFKYKPEGIIEVKPDANGVYVARITDPDKTGTVLLTAASHSDPGVYDTCTVTVTNDAIAPDTLLLDRSTLQFTSEKDKPKELTASFVPPDTTDQRVIWTSSNEKVVKITGADDAHKSLTVSIEPVGPGEATITATAMADGKDGKPIPPAPCVVTVSGIAITHKNEKNEDVTGDVTINVGKDLPLGLKYYGKDVVALDKGDWLWTSDNASVRVDVKTGVISGVSVGKAQVTCRNGPTKAFITVTVVDGESGNIVKRTMTGNNYGLGGVLTGEKPSVTSLSLNICGSDVEYITGLSVDTKQGTLYYGYHSEGDTGAGVSASEKFYASAHGSDKVVERITFVPRDGFTGVAVIPFDGMSKNGKPESYHGEIHITVPAPKEITYVSENGEAVFFHSGDFSDFCKPKHGYAIASVRFPTPPSERYGYLYYDYPGGSVYASNVPATRRYYSASDPTLDSVAFVPREGYTGTFTIPFNGWDAAGNTFNGTIRITVKRSGEAGTGDIAYNAHSGQRQYFDAQDFVDLCRKTTGGNLSYVQFNALPDHSEAVLYAGAAVLSTGSKYYLSAVPRLMDVNILPAANFTGTVTIPFTAADTAGKTFDGSVVVKVTKSGGAAVEIYKTSTGMPVTFARSDFTAACKGVLPEALKSVRFYLPSEASGKLYEGFHDLHSNEPLASDRDLAAKALTNLVFVPKGGFSGSVYLSYTAKDTKDNTCTGTVRVAVWPASTSEYFNDAKSVPWAVSSMDFLRRYGVVTGATETAYAPIQPMGRGDFILMLSRAYAMPEAGRTSFSDVPANSYYAQALASAKHEGIASADASGRFYPAQSVTRQDAALFLYRAMENAGVLSGGNASDLSRFPDGGSVALYAQEAMGALTSRGIFIGDSQGRLNPTSTLTRAEMAVILHRAIT